MRTDGVRKYLDFNEALGCIPKSDTVHTFYNMGNTLFVADWKREEIIDELKKSDFIEICGESARSMSHGICCYTKKTLWQSEVLFIETVESELSKYDSKHSEEIDMDNTIKYRIKIIETYRHLIDSVMANMSSEERAIIERPNIGTVRDGGKGFYANECRKLLSTLLDKYYSTDNLDKWNEFRELLKTRLENELNYEYEEKHTTEIISRNWATNGFIKYMRYAESIVNDV